MSERLKNLLMSTLIVTAAASIPFGLGMVLYMDDGRWAWFCLPLILFLS